MRFRYNLGDPGGAILMASSIEERFIQKSRRTVVVSVWGARSYAAMGIFGLNVWYCVHSHCTFPFTFVGGGGRGGMFYVDQYFKFKDKFYYFYLLECCKTFDVKPIDLS